MVKLQSDANLGSIQVSFWLGSCTFCRLYGWDCGSRSGNVKFRNDSCKDFRSFLSWRPKVAKGTASRLECSSNPCLNRETGIVHPIGWVQRTSWFASCNNSRLVVFETAYLIFKWRFAESNYSLGCWNYSAIGLKLLFTVDIYFAEHQVSLVLVLHGGRIYLNREFKSFLTLVLETWIYKTN